MITEERIAQDPPFLNVVMAHYERIVGKDALSSLREKAWEKFLSMGLPSKAQEAFHRVSLRDLYASFCKGAEKESAICSIDFTDAIASQLMPECQNSYVVFVDGVYRPDLSDISALPSGTVVLPLSQAMQRWKHFLQVNLLKSIKEEKDPFALLNLAVHPQGLFFYSAPKQCIELPIQCIQIATKEHMHFSAPRIQVVLSAQAQVKWISTYLAFGQAPSHCSAPLIDLFLDEASRFELISHLSPAASDWCFDNIRAHLKRDAVLKAVSVIDGSKATRQNIYVQLAGEQAEADVKGLWMLRNDERVHVFAIIDHNAPNTRSMQLFKGVLLDTSLSSFEGKIIVREIAQKTEAYQLNKNLLLGRASIAHSKPNLEIFADDVKASHGSTIARPDEAHIFYLKSRGIDETQAQALLLQGFYQEILEEIPYASLRKAIDLCI